MNEFLLALYVLTTATALSVTIIAATVKYFDTEEVIIFSVIFILAFIPILNFWHIRQSFKYLIFNNSNIEYRKYKITKYIKYN